MTWADWRPYPVTFHNAISWTKTFSIWFYKMCLNFVRNAPIAKKSALVLIRAWCQIGNKIVPEPNITQPSSLVLFYHIKKSQDCVYKISRYNVLQSSWNLLERWILNKCKKWRVYIDRYYRNTYKQYFDTNLYYIKLTKLCPLLLNTLLTFDYLSKLW